MIFNFVYSFLSKFISSYYIGSKSMRFVLSKYRVLVYFPLKQESGVLIFFFLQSTSIKNITLIGPEIN